MFYPKCPACGSDKTESAEGPGLSNASTQVGRMLRLEAMRGHPHPYIKMARMAVMAGQEIYKRVPGGGAKRCGRCGHGFR